MTSGLPDEGASGGALLVVGATSGAGKSTVVAALCRALARRGLSVAPFKAQNMSNHAAVTADGGEIGRAQAVQAEAAGVDLDRRMNPVLLKPRSDATSHVVVMGEEADLADAVGYGAVAERLKPVVLDAFDSLRRDYPWVVAEGAGGAAEINLLDRDLVNLPLAHAAGIPAVLVVDIEPGGAFASAHGTIDLLPEHLRACIHGVIFNRFRGDPSLLDEGNRQLEARDGVPVIGVLPHLGPEPLLGGEDALDVPIGLATQLRGVGEADGVPTAPVRVAAVRLPHLANASDLDPFLIEPAASLRWVIEPSQLADADLIVVPGSRATVNDLTWLRKSGLADALIAAAAGPNPATIVGLCAGYQMLGRLIDDEIESGLGRVEGLGLLPANTRFEEPKILCCSNGTGPAGLRQAGLRQDSPRQDGLKQDGSGHSPAAKAQTPTPVGGYQIRFGRPRTEGASWLTVDGEAEGSIAETAPVYGTSLHGLFDADEFRTAFLADIANARGRRYRSAPVGFAQRQQQQHDRLADWIETHLDIDSLLELGRGAAAVAAGPGWNNPT